MIRAPGPDRQLGVAAGFLGALAVAAGAFGAHALRGRLDPAALATFETAARYHLVHALAAVFAADRSQRLLSGAAGSGAAGSGAAGSGAAGSGAAAGAGWTFLVGVALFSGSLYALALGAPSLVGLITPLGGLAFITAWVQLALSFRSS